jgi:Zn-dependent protease with chaperone function
MKDQSRKALFWTLLISTIGFFVYVLGVQIITWQYIANTPLSWLFLGSLLWGFSELWIWVKVGKRGEMADFAILLMLLFFFWMLTEDLFTGVLGAFGIYLFIGIFELKEYAVLNKLGLITAIVYNLIFVMGLIDHFFPNPELSLRDSAFSFSFWLILILGFAFFGRKYLIVWRFMSPQYLTLGLYLIAWLAVVYVARIFSLDFNLYIYEVLIITNFIVYFLSGPLLGKIMGIKPVQDPELTNVVKEVANQMGIKGRVRVGLGQYPIINAMAYGAFFDKRMGIICEDWRAIPRNELQGIIAHELAHLQGNHTLILALITTVDLVVRKIAAIPATIYDYTFNPGLSERFPMLFFILLNIIIFAFLYIFVRILEGKADRAVRDIGRGEDLARALFNLEGFYAYGREVGLNTMLLCDEKNLPENQELDYFETAQYLSSYLVRPSRVSLVSSLLNSHPPSAIRIASMYDHSFSSWSEALMTFSLLGSRKREQFAKGIENARFQFERQATDQFSRMFQEKTINDFCTRIRHTEDFNLKVGKQHLFTHKIDNTCIFGTIQEVKWQENVGMPTTFVIRGSNGDLTEVPANLYDISPVEVGGHYDLRKIGPVTLESLDIATDLKGATFKFRQKDRTVISLSHKDVKLPTSLDFLDKLVGKLVFLRKHGTIIPYTCQKVEGGSSYQDYSLVVTRRGDNEIETWKAKDMVIFPFHAAMAIHKDKAIWQDQIKVLRTLWENGSRITVNLKKPVNNMEIGKITGINSKSGDLAENILFMNMFQKQKEIPVRDIDYISYSSNNIATFELLDDISYPTKLLHKFTKRIHPPRIFFP